MSCSELLKTTLLGNCIKRKIEEKKYGSFEKNVKFSSNFMKCKFKEIRKLNSYITIYIQKITGPHQEIYPCNYNSSKFISDSPP